MLQRGITTRPTPPPTVQPGRSSWLEDYAVPTAALVAVSLTVRSASASPPVA
jgi:hypothetical protein